ncbi:carbohydrate-binding module family 1 protein [Sphaerobolus stellatus SS14]|uniref:Carbohydrate-binding module family 1 protein n=1 Tax=Sphaerobolus stellatus (strain SS14) TaxID=990650 RepID=A0A0C9VDH9_SPHS4|nr:carbohydrate-binding module family 1 protein [Sphaerobolus stellatus SS14]
MVKLLTVSLVLFALKTIASEEVKLDKCQSCPNIHVFGACETTAPAGYGTAGVVANLVLNTHPGSTAEAINYPTCGSQSQCSGVSYANSVIAGVQGVASMVNSFNMRCLNTQLVLVSYSQGSQIMDDAFCSGGDTNEGLSSTAIPIQAFTINMIKAAIFMGDPCHIPGLSYNVKTCNANSFFLKMFPLQFAPRPAGFQCPSAAKVKSYCNATDPYCCNSSDTNTHQGYGTEYSQQALTFINVQLNTSGSTPVSTSQGGSPPTQTSSPPSGCSVAKWGQCSGQGWTGCTLCASGSTHQAANQWYSQCL